MKRLVESFKEFITSSEIHQNPGAWDYYGANPKKKKKLKNRRPRPNKNRSSEN